MPRVEYEKLASDRAGESSERIRQRVAAARERQQARFKGTTLMCNADTRSAAHIREYCEVDEAGKSLMRAATRSVQLGMSARSFHRVLKLARTIADLEGAEKIQSAHLAEALHLRSTEAAGVSKHEKTVHVPLRSWATPHGIASECGGPK